MGCRRKKRLEKLYQPRDSAGCAPAAGDRQLPQNEAEIIDYARQLLHRHRVDEPLFQSLLKRPGVAGMVELTATIGYYAMISCTRNAFDLASSPNPKDFPILYEGIE
jgi:hypothetical protein